MTVRHDIDVQQGATWSFVWTKLSGGSAVDLTGYTARMTVKQGYSGSSEAFLSTGADANGGTIALGGAQGTVTLSMTAAQTAALANSVDTVLAAISGEDPDLIRTEGPTVVYRYDLELVAADGTVTRELEGRFTVHREVTN